MKCKLCNEKIRKGKEGILDILDSGEKKRLLGLKKKENICFDCKFDLIMLDVINPWR